MCIFWGVLNIVAMFAAVCSLVLSIVRWYLCSLTFLIIRFLVVLLMFLDCVVFDRGRFWVFVIMWFLLLLFCADPSLPPSMYPFPSPSPPVSPPMSLCFSYPFAWLISSFSFLFISRSCSGISVSFSFFFLLALPISLLVFLLICLLMCLPIVSDGICPSFAHLFFFCSSFMIFRYLS